MPSASVTPRPEDRPRGRAGLVVGAALRRPLRPRGRPAGSPRPSARDFAAFLDSDRGEDFFRGAWGWFALFVVLGVFNTVLGEELLFRGLLLPRMRGVFGRWGTGSPTGCCSRPTTCTAVGDPHHPDPRRARLPVAAVPECLDGDPRALGPERLLHRHRPGRRAQLVVLPFRDQAAFTVNSCSRRRGRARWSRSCRSTGLAGSSAGWTTGSVFHGC